MILVTGATGQTGRETIPQLVEHERPVRALVHSEDERAEGLKAPGAEVVVGDLLDLDAVRAALEGVRAAYFVYPIHPGLIDASAFFAQAAKEAAYFDCMIISSTSRSRSFPKKI